MYIAMSMGESPVTSPTLTKMTTEDQIQAAIALSEEGRLFSSLF